MDAGLEQFDHHSPAFAADPWSVYQRLRAECPALRAETHGGFWVFTRYRDVVRIAKDDATFSSASGVVVPPQPAGVIPIDTDPPEFFAYRRMLNPLFSPAAVDRLEPEIRRVAAQLVDGFIERGACDLIEDFAQPLPAIITLGMCGFPPEEWHDFSFPIHHGIFNTKFDDPDLAARVAGGVPWMRERVREAVADRRRSPREDVIGYFVDAEVDGRRLSDDEIVNTVSLILIGGLDTTTSAIGNALLQLDARPEDRGRLVTDAAAMRLAVEEFLRYEAPVQSLARTLTCDAEIAGAALKKGDKVLISWASANRDEDEFPDANEVVIDRFPNRHLTFGIGIHRCLGSNLARREIDIAVAEVLRRMPDYRIDRAGVVQGADVSTVFGHIRIPATFTPGTRVT